MRRWLGRHPITVCIGSLWLFAVIAVVVIDACLPDAPTGSGCFMGPDCVRSPKSDFYLAVGFGAAPAALVLALLGAGLGLLLKKLVLRRADSSSTTEMSVRESEGPLRGAVIFAQWAAFVWAATLLAISGGLLAQHYDLVTVAFAVGGAYYIAVALRAGLRVRGDMLIIRSTFRAEAVPLSAIDAVRVEAYDGALAWGQPSRGLSMLSVVADGREHKCRLTVSPRRHCRWIANALRDAVAVARTS